MKIPVLIIFWSLWFLNFSSRTLLSPLLPLIEDELSITHTFAGSLFFFLSLGHTTSVFLSGMLSLKFGYKRLIITSYMILPTALIMLKYAVNYSVFAAICLFMGFGSGAYLPCALPLLTSIIDRSKWGRAITFHETASSLSILTIPIVTAIALGLLKWRNLFLLVAALCLVASFFFWRYVPDTRATDKEEFRYSSILGQKNFWIMAMLMTIAAMSSAGLYNIMPLYLVEVKGLELQMANSVFGFSRIGGFVIMILTGILIDRYRIKVIFLLILLTTGLSIIGIAVIRTVWLLLAMLIIQGTFSIVFFPVSFVAISKITSLSERAAFTGTSSGFAVIFGVGLTPLLLGAIADAVSFQAGILGLGVLTLISSIPIKGLGDI